MEREREKKKVKLMSNMIISVVCSRQVAKKKRTEEKISPFFSARRKFQMKKDVLFAIILAEATLFTVIDADL